MTELAKPKELATPEREFLEWYRANFDWADAAGDPEEFYEVAEDWARRQTEELRRRLELAEGALRDSAARLDAVKRNADRYDGRSGADFISHLGEIAECGATDARAVLAAIPKEGA